MNTRQIQRDLESYCFGRCEFDGSSDLYPLKNKRLLNNDKYHKAAIIIQKTWRSKHKGLEAKSEKFFERYWSWLSF